MAVAAKVRLVPTTPEGHHQPPAPRLNPMLARGPTRIQQLKGALWALEPENDRGIEVFSINTDSIGAARDDGTHLLRWLRNDAIDRRRLVKLPGNVAKTREVDHHRGPDEHTI